MSTAIACRLLVISSLFSTACLGPLASDEPGFSPRILDRDAAVPEPGTALARSIAEEDGIDGPSVPLEKGFKGGEEVSFWDFGEAPGVMRVAYQLYVCDDDEPEETIDHPVVLSAVPGASDYSPFLALQPVCVTSQYESQQIISTRALRDATDIGLVREPLPPHVWVDAPVVEDGISLEGAEDRSAPIYYDGLTLHSLRPSEPREWSSKFVPTARAYELSRPAAGGATEQVVFEESTTPLWEVVSVELSEDAELSELTSAADLFEVDDEGVLHPASDLVESFEETGVQAHRALVQEGPR